MTKTYFFRTLSLALFSCSLSLFTPTAALADARDVDEGWRNAITANDS